MLSRMLFLAVEAYERPGLEVLNFTDTHVLTELFTKNIEAKRLPEGMIDYVVTVEPPERQRVKLRKIFNPASYWLPNYAPVAVIVKNNCKEREDGEVHLCLWLMAYLKLLNKFVENSVSITVPLILVRNEYWTLLFAKDLGRRISLIDAGTSGDSSDIIGCYNILAGLNLLFDWLQDHFLA